MTLNDEINIEPKIKKYLQKKLGRLTITKNFSQTVETLNLANLQLTSTKGLEYFTHLKKLNISQNHLTDSSFLKQMDQLVDLDISFNQFETITLTSQHIETLNVRGNRLKTINFIQSLKQLISLNVRENNITHLTPVQGLRHLKYLNVRDNNIQSLTPLKNLQNLAQLNIQNNRIHSIKPLLKLPSLERVRLKGNAIDDLNLLTHKHSMIQNVDLKATLSKPKLSANSGLYEQKFFLEITAEDGQDIYYTLDGSKPTKHSSRYRKPIEISKEIMHRLSVIANDKTSPLHDGFQFTAEDVKKAITVSAVAYDGNIFSDMNVATYILKGDLFSHQSLPVISLTIDPIDFFDPIKGIYVPGHLYVKDDAGTGNYYQRGKKFEKLCTVEWFTPTGSLNFNQRMGVRINGSFTRRFPQKSLRLYARSRYGQSHIYPNSFKELPYQKFKRLVLRNAGDDHYSTLIRDGLMHELVKDLTVDVQAYQPAVVLMNGEYWGIHNVREKFTKHFIKIKYNINEDEFILLKTDKKRGHFQFKVDHGKASDVNDYDYLRSFVRDHDMSLEQNMNVVQALIDLDNFIEYVAIQVYYANTDSFSNNLMVWRKKVPYTPAAPRGHDGRWRYLLYDLDWGMGYGLLNLDGDPVTFNMLKYVLSDREEMALFKGLMENQSFREKFLQVMLKLLRNQFAPRRVKQMIDKLSNQIRSEIKRSITRWENIQSVEKWEKNINQLYEFAERRPSIVKQHLKDEFDLSEKDLE